MERRFRLWEKAALLALRVTLLQSVMGRGDYGIVSEEGYVLRFRILELWGELNDCIRRHFPLYWSQNPNGRDTYEALQSDYQG